MVKLPPSLHFAEIYRGYQSRNTVRQSGHIKNLHEMKFTFWIILFFAVCTRDVHGGKKSKKKIKWGPEDDLEMCFELCEKIHGDCILKVKATTHLICSSSSNWVNFVKSGCEKSWAEVQVDSFSFECRGCTKMKELEVELEQISLLVVAMVGREQVDERRWEGNKWEGRQMDRRRGEWGDSSEGSGGIVKAMGVRETGGKVSGGNATGAQVKGDSLMGERETDNCQETKLQDRM
ncbi:hypothetical protein LSAT2_010020 [Lamellibrachia satsuma]|nr:hypothetical protein LSAT2_010020 [Lamellibrachia satsuma]